MAFLEDYKMTNERVKAIVKGLAPSIDDTVVSIGAYGEQPFALLEKAGRVEAFDTSSSSVRIMGWKIEHIRQGDFEEFIRLVFPENRGYWAHPGRLEAIRDKLDNLTVHSGCIFKYLKGNPSQKPSRIYLSNSISDSWNSWKPIGSTEGLNIAAKALEWNGLIYVSDGDEIGSDRYSWKGTLEGLAIDSKLTRIARGYQKGSKWSPIVWRKKGEDTDSIFSRYEGKGTLGLGNVRRF